MQNIKETSSVLNSPTATSKTSDLTSPLHELYSGSSIPKTGKGYGLQHFRIPKIKRNSQDSPSQIIPRPPTPPKLAGHLTKVSSSHDSESANNQDYIESLIKKSLESGQVKEFFDKAKLIESLAVSLKETKIKKIKAILDDDDEDEDEQTDEKTSTVEEEEVNKIEKDKTTKKCKESEESKKPKEEKQNEKHTRKPRRNSVEMLQDDIREIFMNKNGEITSTGVRMCRMLKQVNNGATLEQVKINEEKIMEEEIVQEVRYIFLKLLI